MQDVRTSKTVIKDNDDDNNDKKSPTCLLPSHLGLLSPSHCKQWLLLHLIIFIVIVFIIINILIIILIIMTLSTCIPLVQCSKQHSHTPRHFHP